MDACSIIYENWQMQCCGTPFEIGETITWLVAKWDSVWNTTWESSLMQFLLEINYYYEAHSSEYEKLFVINGKVNKIIAIHSSIEPNPNDLKSNIRVPKIVLPVNHADGKDEDIDGFELDSYFITLVNAAIRPANPKDVIFH